MNVEKARKLVTVICACIRREGGQQVLLSYRRAPGVPGLDGKWELPGGKIEFGETPEQALIREIREEIGIEVRPLRLLPYLHTNVWEYEHAVQQVVLACYECEPGEGSEQSKPTEDVRWFDVNEIDFHSALPGTQEFIGLALGNDWFDNLFIQFELDDPAAGAKREFRLTAQPTLYTDYAFIKHWGRIGSSRSKWELFDSPEERDSRIFTITRHRLSDGFRIAKLEGQRQRYPVLGKIIELARGKHALAGDVPIN